VLIGSDHLVPLIAELATPPPGLRDAGAKAYLARHDTVLVDCGDLASGEDRDSLG